MLVLDWTMSEENHRIWGTGVSGWGTRKDRRLNYREKFWVDGGNQIWRNCYECEEEESSRWWEQLQQNYENQSMWDTWDRQQTTVWWTKSMWSTLLTKQAVTINSIMQYKHSYLVPTYNRMYVFYRKDWMSHSRTNSDITNPALVEGRVSYVGRAVWNSLM